MIATDPKGFCKLDGATTGVGWWWGEVGGVVAGSDGSVADDGRFDFDFADIRHPGKPLPKRLPPPRITPLQRYPPNPRSRSPR